MKSIWILLAAAITAGAIKTEAASAVDVPRNAGEFVTYCRVSDAKGCEGTVTIIDTFRMAKKPDHCTAVKIDLSTETRMVVDWIDKNPEMHTLAVRDAIAHALDALWPCQ